MTNDFPPAFARQYDSHLKHLKLKGLQPKTIDSYARAIRRLGGLSWALPLSRGDPGGRSPGLRSGRRRPGQLPLPGQPQRGDADPHAARRRLPAPAPATRPAQGLPALVQLRLPASEQERADRPAASRAAHRPAPAATKQTPAGLALPVLLPADAGDPAAPATGGGQATRDGAGHGDGRVSPAHRSAARRPAPRPRSAEKWVKSRCRP